MGQRAYVVRQLFPRSSGAVTRIEDAVGPLEAAFRAASELGGDPRDVYAVEVEKQGRSATVVSIRWQASGLARVRFEVVEADAEAAN